MIEYQMRQKVCWLEGPGIFGVVDDRQLEKIDDGRAERIPSPEHFIYEKYGINMLS